MGIKKGLIKNCYCGNQFYIPISSNNRKYCSHKCADNANRGRKDTEEQLQSRIERTKLWWATNPKAQARKESMRKLMSVVHTGKKLYPHQIEKLRITWLGRKHTPETIQKMKVASLKVDHSHLFSESARAKHRLVMKKMRGKTYEDRYGERAMFILKKKSGANSHFWQGGKSFEPYPEKWTSFFKQKIRKRDNNACQICGNIYQKKMCVHHIFYDKDDLNPDHLISVCRSCHSKTNRNRTYWSQKCIELLESKQEVSSVVQKLL